MLHMAELSPLDAHRCSVSGGILIHQHKILLVKHKKLKMWLVPGGHLEPDELPHLAAEREFWEETNIRVKAVSSLPVPEGSETEYLPLPLLSNAHWISEQNYQERLSSGRPKPATRTHDLPMLGCEQHVIFTYLVQPTSGIEFSQNIEETDDIGWFSEREVAALDTKQNIKAEVEYAFAFISGKIAPSAYVTTDHH